MPPKRKLDNILRSSNTSKQTRTRTIGSSSPPPEQHRESATDVLFRTNVGLSAASEPSTPPPANSDAGVVPAASPVSSATATASRASDDQGSQSATQRQNALGDGDESTSTEDNLPVTTNTANTAVVYPNPTAPAAAADAVPAPIHALVDLTVADVRRLLQAQYLFTPGLAERAHEVLTWSDPETHTFSIHRLPMNLVWEKTTGSKVVDANVMHIQGTASPCVAWILGRVASTWFFDGEGSPNKIPAITVDPIHPQTLVVARDVLHSVPVQQQTIRASKFSTSWVRGERASKPIALQCVYDATNGNVGYPIGGLCKKIDASEIAEKDLVLLETTLSRYREGNGNMRHNFNIHSISLLVCSDM